MNSISNLRAYWTATGSRQEVTRIAMAEISKLRGNVLDIGGGRCAPHDGAWDASVTRMRLDISTVHGPDVQADARQLPFGDSSFDAAVMIETLEHIADPWAAIEEIHRVLRPKGSLFGTVAFIYPVHGDPHDYYRYGADGLQYLLRSFNEVHLRAHGNAYGAAWSLLSLRSRAWRAFNPLGRVVGRTPDPRCPQGYTFTARR